MEEDEAASEQEELARFRRWAAGEGHDEPVLVTAEGEPASGALSHMWMGAIQAFDAALRLCGGLEPGREELHTLRVDHWLWVLRRHWEPNVLLIPDLANIYGLALDLMTHYGPAVVQRLPSRMPVGLVELLDPEFGAAAMVARFRARADRDFDPADRVEYLAIAPDAPPAEQAAFHAPSYLRDALFSALRCCAYPGIVDARRARAEIDEALIALREGLALAEPDEPCIGPVVAGVCEAFLVPDPAPERRPVPARLDLTLAELRDPGFDADALFARIRAARPPG